MQLKLLSHNILAFICIIISFSFQICFAQDEEGFIDMHFDIRDHNQKTSNEAINISVYIDNKEIQKIKTDKRGNARIELKYGPTYRIVFSKADIVTCYLLLNSNIPQKKRITISNFAQTVFVVSRNETIIDTLRFKHPFTKWFYDEKDSRFKEDTDYLKEFSTGIFKEDEAAKELTSKQLTENQAKEKTDKDRKESNIQQHAAVRAEYKKQKKIAGKIVTMGKRQRPVVGATVSLFNANKEQIGTTITNALGGFVLIKNEKDGDNMSIEVDRVNTKYNVEVEGIAITNHIGKEIKKSLIDSKGKFIFRFLAADEKLFAEMIVDDADLRMDIQGQILKSSENKQQPMANITLKYVDELGNIIVSVVTDAQGKFQFKSLVNDAFYLFSIDEKDVKLQTGEKIILADASGKIIKELQKDGDNAFNFEIASSDQNGGLTSLYYNDPWLKVIDPSRVDKDQSKELIIKEKVYFTSNDATLLPEAKRVLDEVVTVMENVQNINVELSSHSDSKGSDEYNLALSKKRAKAAVDYIVFQGVSANRITGIGYGETKLVNRCSNGIDCTEEEHAENRRLEFKVIRK